MAMNPPLSESLAETAAQHLTNQQYFLALDVARAARAADGQALAPLLVMALALLRVGEASEVNGLLAEIDDRFVTYGARLKAAYTAFAAVRTGGATPHPDDPDDPDLLPFGRFADALAALIARTDRHSDLPRDHRLLDLLLQVHQESWRRFGRRQYLKQGRNLARSSYRRTGHAWHGFLAAILAWHLGDRDQARRLGAEVAAGLRAGAPLEPAAAATDARPEEFSAALGGAIVALMLDDPIAAEPLFQRAARLAGRRLHLIVDARREVNELAAAGLAVPPGLVELFPLPVVAICAGQPLDRPGAGAPIFPTAITPAVEAAIRDQIDRLDVGIGYCRAAAGADLLLAEALLRRGAEVNVWLPYRRDEFAHRHVAFAGPDWLRRFAHVLRLADTVRTVSDDRHDDGVAIRYANQVMDGSARLRAEILDVRPSFLGVWDYSLGASPGSVSDFIDHWGDPARLRLIHLDEIRDHAGIVEPGGSATVAAESDPPTTAPSARRVMALLFADLIGFSRLEDNELAGFWDFVGAAHERVVRSGVAEPFLIESWGDCFFVTIEEPLAMADYAFALTEAFAAVDSAAFGLSTAPRLRVAVHAGPVSTTRNRFTERPIVFGKHVSRAARIEPITVPGQIYASEEFVALLTADESAAAAQARAGRRPYRRRYACEYVGRLTLPKEFGEQPVYRLSKAAHPPTGG